MQFGQLIVLKEFGVVPQIGWQIDEFGLSSTNARLFAEMGIKAIFMNRIDVHERSARRDKRELEFLWRPYWPYSGKETQVIGHVFWHHYSPPEFWEISTYKDLLLSKTPASDQEWD